MKKGAISALIATLTLLSMPMSSPGVEVGHWSFDEGAGSTIHDSSPAGNHGEISDLSMWTTPGYDGAGACLRFNGIYTSPSVQAVVPHDASLDFADGISLSAWVWQEPLGGTQTLAPIVCKGDSSMTSYVMYLLGLEVAFQGNNWYGSSTLFGVRSGATISFEEWAHVKATYDMEFVRLYIDWQLVKEEPVSIPITNATVPLFFGVDYFGFVERFKGYIDEVVIESLTDDTPPVIKSVSASPDVLWPPNHKMVEVAVLVEAEDDSGEAPTCRIVDVTCNEPVNGPGDGNTESDWEITGDLTVELRAERSGVDDARIYAIHVECADTSGNTSTGTVDVVVPHDQAKRN